MNAEARETFAQFVEERSASLMRLAYVLAGDQHAHCWRYRSANARCSSCATTRTSPNTPAESEVARACLRRGKPLPPTGMKNGPEVTDFGDYKEYRLLISLRHKGQTVAMVGGGKGFVLCVRTNGQNVEPPCLQSSRDWDKLHHVVAGRTKPGVTKVVVTWNRNRTVEATVRNGFFIARVDSEMVPAEREFEGDMPGAMYSRDEQVLKVEAYGNRPGPLFTWNAGRNGGVTMFNVADCDEGAKTVARKKGLCEGLPEGGS